MVDVTPYELLRQAGIPKFWNWGFNVLATNESLIQAHWQLEEIDQHLDMEWAAECVKATNHGYILCGLVLQKIFRYKLWEKLGFKSVADFCQKTIRRSVWYCKQTIRAAIVAVELVRAGFETVPTCQSQAELLFKFVEEASTGNLSFYFEKQDELVQAWKSVVEASESECCPVTTPFIKKILYPEEEKVTPSKVSVDPETYKTIEAEARKQGISPSEWLKRLVQEKLAEGEQTSVADPEAEAAWERDLEELIEEYDDSTGEDIPRPQNLRIGDRIVTAEGVATITEVRKSVVWANYSDGDAKPHQLDEILSVVPRPLDNS